LQQEALKMTPINVLGYIRGQHMGLVALMVALGGTSYAAASLPSHSVGTAQLKNAAVTRAKLGKDAVRSSNVADHSLLARDFMAGQLPSGPHGATGATGKTGAPGPQGPPGPTAAAFTSTDSPKSIVSNGPVPIVSLSTPSDNSSTDSTGKLTVSFPARVIVEANTTVLTTGTSIHTAECLVTLTDATGGITQVGQTVFFLQNIANDETVVHVTGGARVAPGTYDATLSCVGDATGAEAYRSDIVAFAAADTTN
jgi:hypothetical protein